MRLCFHHQPFDHDVSSGTDHARHQWHELAVGFGVTELAVINETAEPYEALTDELPVTEYVSLNEFLIAETPRKNRRKPSFVFIEQGSKTRCRNYPFKPYQWIVIGGNRGLLLNVPGADYVSLAAKTALYPREAAAIALDNAAWRQ